MFGVSKGLGATGPFPPRLSDTEQNAWPAFRSAKCDRNRTRSPGSVGGATANMSKPVRIALDAMGGDFGPEVVVPGAALALERRPDATFILFGKEPILRPLLDAHPKLAAKAVLKHTDVAIQMHEKPTQALRSGRRVSSMWMA